jgi:hypothetical protein
MKKSICIPLASAFLLLFCWSCQEEPTALQRDSSDQQVPGGLARPPSGQLTCNLVLTASDPIGLPDFSVPPPGKLGVKVHYEISGPDPITNATIYIIYDDDQDGAWNISYAERVRIIQIPCDGTQRTMQADMYWNGEADPDHSAWIINGQPYIFDRYPSGSPDWYLFQLRASDGRRYATNWRSSNDVGPICPSEAIAHVTPLKQDWPKLHITSIQPISTPGKGKYVAALKASITCASSGGLDGLGFSGLGTWVQVYPDGHEGAPLVYSGSLGCCSFTDDGDPDAEATTSCTLQVGPGTYRFYVRTLYSPHYSYFLPNDCESANLPFPPRNLTPYGWITVP